MPIGKLKHPVIENIEYLDVRKGNMLLKTFGKEVEGKKWRKLQEIIGDEVGTQLYTYVYKQKNSDVISKGQIRGIKVGEKLPQPIVKSDDGLILLQKSIADINKKIDNSSQGIGVETVISIMRTTHETQITFLNGEITRRDNIIIKYENKIETLENELDSRDDSSGVSMMEYFKIAQEFISMKVKGVQPITNLEDSNSADIPGDILKLLGMVEWSNVPDEVVKTIVETLSQYIQKLPLKGK